MQSSKTLSIIIRAQDQASRVMESAESKISGATSRISGAVVAATKAVALAGAAFIGASSVIGYKFNSSVEQAEAKLMAFMKDGERVAKTLAWVKEEAAATQFSFTDMADAAANLTPVSKSTGVALEDLVKQAEILAALNPEQGLTGAVFSLREALGGDWISIIDRFNLPRKRINELKEEGVPAMEAISRVLNEMGIDYSLVEAQGRTAAAGFDQVKDKLIMMAGEATKPIFERIKQGLGSLNEFNFQALGEKMSGMVSGVLAWFDVMIPKVIEVGQAVWDYLGPKFQNLWKVIQEDLMPSLSKLYHEVIVPLAPLVGAVLVFAFGVLIDILVILVRIISNVIDWFSNLVTFLMVTLPNAIQGAGASFSQFIAGLIKGAGDAVNNVSNWFSQLPSRIISYLLSLPGLVLGIFNNMSGGALGVVFTMVSRIISFISSLPGSIAGAVSGIMGILIAPFEGAYNRIAGIVNGIKNIISGIAGAAGGAIEAVKGIKVPGFASGVRNFSGGLAVVGEKGPELVNLPKGSDVFSNSESQGMMGSTFNMYGNVMLGDASAVDRYYERFMGMQDMKNSLSEYGVGG